MCATAVALAAVASDDVGQARALALRLDKALSSKVEFVKIDAEQGHDVFTLESLGGKVIIGGNNANSMAVGLNRYLNRYCKTTVSWYAGVPVSTPMSCPTCLPPSG